MTYEKLNEEYHRFWELIVIVVLVGFLVNILADNISILLDFLPHEWYSFLVLVTIGLLVFSFFYYFTPNIETDILIPLPLIWIPTSKDLIDFDAPAYKNAAIALKELANSFPELEKDLVEIRHPPKMFLQLVSWLMIVELGPIIGTGRTELGASHLFPMLKKSTEDFILPRLRNKKNWGIENLPKKLKEEDPFFNLPMHQFIQVDLPRNVDIKVEESPFNLQIKCWAFRMVWEFEYSVMTSGDLSMLEDLLSQPFVQPFKNWVSKSKVCPKGVFVYIHVRCKASASKWWRPFPILHGRGMGFWNWALNIEDNFILKFKSRFLR